VSSVLDHFFEILQAVSAAPISNDLSVALSAHVEIFVHGPLSLEAEFVWRVSGYELQVLGPAEDQVVFSFGRQRHIGLVELPRVLVLFPGGEVLAVAFDPFLLPVVEGLAQRMVACNNFHCTGVGEHHFDSFGLRARHHHECAPSMSRIHISRLQFEAAPINCNKTETFFCSYLFNFNTFI